MSEEHYSKLWDKLNETDIVSGAWKDTPWEELFDLVKEQFKDFVFAINIGET